MIRKALLTLAAWILLGPAAAARGNPIPSDQAEEFRNLVVATARDGACPDSARLARHFGAFGLGLLSPDQIEGIEAHFRTFAPILAASQAPDYEPDFAVQRLYRRHASPQEREWMLESLRKWLTAKVQVAPIHGTLRIAGPESVVKEETRKVRAEAAEMLADWGDAESSSAIRKLYRRTPRRDRTRWYLRRSEERLHDPCAMTLLRQGPDGSLIWCANRREIVEAAAIPPGTRHRMEEDRLADAELDELWSALAGGRLGGDSRSEGPAGIVLETADGVRAELHPTGDGIVIYTDNTSLDPRSRIGLQSNELWTIVTKLATRRRSARDR